MKKPSRPKLCMFCAKDKSFGPMNREHFVFKALWSGPRPKGTKTVWAHESCNAKFSEDNEYVRDVLAIDAGAAQHPEVQRLLEGELSRKLHKRPAEAAKVLKNLRLVPLFTPSGLYVGRTPVFDVDWTRMERVLQNVVKGIYYTAVKAPLPAECLIRVIDVTGKELPKDVATLIEQMVGPQSFGDDVFVCRYVTISTSPFQRITCLMQFYRNRIFFGEAMTKELFEEIKSREKQ